jgi:hypothetical protein
MNRHHAALQPVACETAGSQALASGGPLQVAEGDAPLPFLPALAENSRSDIGHSSRVWICLGGNVKSAPARTFDHFKAQRRFAQANAGNVHYV